MPLTAWRLPLLNGRTLESKLSGRPAERYSPARCTSWSQGGTHRLTPAGVRRLRGCLPFISATMMLEMMTPEWVWEVVWPSNDENSDTLIETTVLGDNARQQGCWSRVRKGVPGGISDGTGAKLWLLLLLSLHSSSGFPLGLGAIITMFGLQKPDFLTCGVFIYFLQIDNELLLCSCNGNMQLGFWKWYPHKQSNRDYRRTPLYTYFIVKIELWDHMQV